MLNIYESDNSNKKIEITLKPSPDVPNSTLLYIKTLIQAAISNPQGISNLIQNDISDVNSNFFNENSSDSGISVINATISRDSLQQSNGKNRGRGRPSKSHKEPMDVEQFKSASPEKKRYLELRYRNNIACRLARKKRKIQEKEIFSEEMIEIRRNEKLRAELERFRLEQIDLINRLERRKVENSYESFNTFKTIKMKAHKVRGSNLLENCWMSPTTTAEITSH